MKTLADFIRPSSLHAIAQCPGRPTIEAAIVNLEGEPESSPEASMGHRAHAIVAQAIEDWKCEPAAAHWDIYIAKARDDAAAVGLDSWTIYCVRFCLETARDLIAKYGIEPENVLVEHRLEMSDIGMAGGTADLILVDPFKRVIGVDWKFTFVDQGDASDHDQLQSYAVASASTFSVPEVIVYLVAPRADKAARITSAKFDADSLRANAAWTRAVVARALSTNPELAPEYSACVYCRAVRHCPAVKEHLVNTQEALAVLGAPITPEAWGEAIAAAKLAEKWGEQWKDAGRAHLIAGGEAVGFKLGAGRSIESVANVPEAIAKLREAGMEAEALEAASISAGKLPPAAREIIAEHITTKISAPSLVASKRGRAA